MADAGRSLRALGGLALSPGGRPRCLCLSFATPPYPALSEHSASGAPEFIRRIEDLLRGSHPCNMQLLEITGPGGTAVCPRVLLELGERLPHGFAGEIAPGRFGIVDTGGTDLATVVAMLERSLRSHAPGVQIQAQDVRVSGHDLSPVQAVRALRQALAVFARDGVGGLTEAGFGGGLAGYIAKAGATTGLLRRAIRTGQFSMVFQPIVSLTGRAVHHYEALIRPRPIEGCSFGTTQEFVRQVEALGLSDQLDLAVATSACDAASRAGVPVAFNLSAQSAQNAPLRKRLMAGLATSPACRDRLLLVEMTETAEITDMDEVVRTAEAFRELGIPFCLDDFGAGAADMRMLRALKIDFVKLDGCYVAGLTAGGQHKAFVAAMSEMGHASGAAVVAERVETEAEAAMLTRLGVEYGQGWLFGKPGPLPLPPTPHAAARRRGEVESWG